MDKLVSIIILTHDSEEYIQDCLKSILGQTYKNFEILIVDNNSSDKGIEVAKMILKEFKGSQRIISNLVNMGVAGGYNVGVKESKGEYIIILNQDIILDENFIQKIIDAFGKDIKIGSVQAKILQLNNGRRTDIIDTAGFKFFKSGEINDLGQGEKDVGQYDNLQEIFGANGVAPAYRRIALDNIRLKEEYFDEDFFMYAEDFDLAWRMNANGWLTVFEPQAVVWHDRTSSKSIGGGWKKFRETRKSQSLWLRKISWRNMWLAYIKNLPLKSFFHPQFLSRQIKFNLYLLIFEPKVLVTKFQILKLLPKMLKKRKIIMKSKLC